jgi:hypothetical protein
VPPNPSSQWNLVPTIEAVGVCRVNALRLLRDARRCKSPARLALAELSIEQAVLGWILYIRITLHKSRSLLAELRAGHGIENLDPGTPAWMRQMLEELPGLDDAAVIRAFKNHPIRVRELRPLVEWVTAAIAGIPTSVAVTPQVMLNAPGQYLLLYLATRGHWVNSRILRAFERHASALTDLGIDHLDRTMKNDAFYVTFDPASGTCGLPLDNPAAYDHLVFISRTLNYLLQGLIRGERVWREHQPAR